MAQVGEMVNANCRRRRSTCRRGTVSTVRFLKFCSGSRTRRGCASVDGQGDPRFLSYSRSCMASRSGLLLPERPSEADSSKSVVEAGFDKPQPVNAERPPAPGCARSSSLYELIVFRHIPLPPRAGESIREHIARFDAIAAKEESGDNWWPGLTENRFNRKVETKCCIAFTLAGTRRSETSLNGLILWKKSKCTR